jgi:plasmid stabilization system protein ParE
MLNYDFQNDVTEWIGEFGGAENAEPYLKALADRFAKAGEANKAYHYRKLAAEMRRIMNGPAPVVVRMRRNA